MVAAVFINFVQSLFIFCFYFPLLSSSLSCPYSVRSFIAFDACVWINNHPRGVEGEGQGEGQGWPLSVGGKKG